MPRRPFIAPVPLAAAALVFVAVDLLLADFDSTAVHGVLDEAAHFVTGLFVLAAVWPLAPRGFVVGLLVSSVAIDLDHVPQYLGADFLTRGTARPYPHSLLTLAAMAAVLAVVPARWRVPVAGVLVGLAVHFFRDLAEPGSGVALLWPFSDHTFSLPYLAYGAFTVGLFAVALLRSLRLRRWMPRD